MTVISSASPMTWLLVMTTPLARTMTPDPSELSTRSRGTAPIWSPKNWRKKGSFISGETCCLRTRLV
jgi:hypothetical protein